MRKARRTGCARSLCRTRARSRGRCPRPAGARTRAAAGGPAGRSQKKASVSEGAAACGKEGRRGDVGVCVRCGGGGPTSTTAPRYLSGGGRFGADDIGAGAVGVGVEVVEVMEVMEDAAWGMEEKRDGKRGAVQSRAEQDGRRGRGGHDIWAEEVTCTDPAACSFRPRTRSHASAQHTSHPALHVDASDGRRARAAGAEAHPPPQRDDHQPHRSRRGACLHAARAL